MNPESAKIRRKNTVAKNLGRASDDPPTFRVQNPNDYSVITVLTAVAHDLHLIPHQYRNDPRAALTTREIEHIVEIAAKKNCPYPEQALLRLAELEKAAEIYLIENPISEELSTPNEIYLNHRLGTMIATIPTTFLKLSSGEISLGRETSNLPDLPHLRITPEKTIALVSEVDTANGKKVVGYIHSYIDDTQVTTIHLDNIAFLPPYSSRSLVKEWCKAVVEKIFSSPLNNNAEISAAFRKDTAYKTTFPLILAELRRLRPDLNFGVVEEVDNNRGGVNVKIKPFTKFDYQPLIEKLGLVLESTSRNKEIDLLLNSKNRPDSRTIEQLQNDLKFSRFDLAWCDLIRTIALGEERLAKNQISHLYIWVHPEYRDFGICDNKQHWESAYRLLDELTKNPQCALAVCSWLPERDIASVRRRAKEEMFSKQKTERYLEFVQKQEEFYLEAQKRLGKRFIFWPSGMIVLNSPYKHDREVDYLSNIFNVEPRCFSDYNKPFLLQYADCFGLLPNACVAVQAGECGLRDYVLETDRHGTMAPPPTYRGR